MTEENLLTGGIDKFNLAMKFKVQNGTLSKINFIPWEHSSEGEKLKEKFELDYSGNQISILVNQMSTIFTI